MASNNITIFGMDFPIALEIPPKIILSLNDLKNVTSYYECVESWLVKCIDCLGIDLRYCNSYLPSFYKTNN